MDNKLDTKQTLKAVAEILGPTDYANRLDMWDTYEDQLPDEAIDLLADNGLWNAWTRVSDPDKIRKAWNSGEWACEDLGIALAFNPFTPDDVIEDIVCHDADDGLLSTSPLRCDLSFKALYHIAATRNPDKNLRDEIRVQSVETKADNSRWLATHLLTTQEAVDLIGSLLDAEAYKEEHEAKRRA